jgi:hemerythrin
MEFIAWQESYSVGHSQLDQQHQRQVGMINNLGEAMEAGTEKMAMMNFRISINLLR